MATLAVAAAGLMAKGSADIGSHGLAVLRGRLGESLGLPHSGPADHPEVLYTAGYRPPAGGRTAGQHTSTAVARIRRGPRSG